MATAKKTAKKRAKKTIRKTAKSTTSKKDLEAKIADLEAKLNKLAAATAKPAETKASVKPAPKPAEVKPAETAPKPAEVKPAETKPAPKPAEKAPPAPVALHERFREIPTGNWNTQKIAITGFTAPGNRYFGSRALVAGIQVTPSNWNDHKTKITGFTAPGNKYFATKQRLAYHPEAKKFGTWINDAPASGQAKAAPPPKPAKSPEELAKDDYAAKMKSKGATLPKGF